MRAGDGVKPGESRPGIAHAAAILSPWHGRGRCAGLEAGARAISSGAAQHPCFPFASRLLWQTCLVLGALASVSAVVKGFLASRAYPTFSFFFSQLFPTAHPFCSPQRAWGRPGELKQCGVRPEVNKELVGMFNANSYGLALVTPLLFNKNPIIKVIFAGIDFFFSSRAFITPMSQQCVIQGGSECQIGLVFLPKESKIGGEETTQGARGWAWGRDCGRHRKGFQKSRRPNSWKLVHLL